MTDLSNCTCSYGHLARTQDPECPVHPFGRTTASANPSGLTLSGHMLEAYKAMRKALNVHTEPLQGYTANKQRDAALDEAAHHIERARALIGEKAA
jgi:hypothetical protein